MRNDMEIVDAHAHLFPNAEVGRRILEGVKKELGAQYYCTGSPGELAEAMRRSGVSYAVALNQAAANEEAIENLVSGNFFVCAHSCKHPELIPAIGLDKHMKRDPVAEIDHKLKWGARAVKLHPEAQKFYANDRAMWPVYAKCEKEGLPVIFHCGICIVEGPVSYAHPALFRDVLCDFPRLRVVLAHMGGGYWDDAVRIAEEFPENVYFDTAIAVSALPIPEKLRLDDGRAVEMIRRVGAHRVMFGSDFPWVNPGPDIERIRSLDLEDGEKAMILGDNAKKLFGIK